jgi:hypothetical protein
VTLARRFDFFVRVLVAAAPSATVGCATTAPTTGNTPITGIEIPADTIVASGGCGTGADQVFKYAAVVSTPTVQTFVTSGVFDCFADGIFSNLPSPDGGSETFNVSIYAYNQASFPKALLCLPSTAPCPGDDAGAIAPWQSSANWTTTCTVIQVQGVTSITKCGPLEPIEPIEAGSSGDSSSDSSATE